MVTDYVSARLTPEQRRAMQCEGKERFDDPRRARKIARRQSRKYGRPFNAYHCPLCGGWHTGSERGPDSRKKFEPLTPEEDAEWQRVARLNAAKVRKPCRKP